MPIRLKGIYTHFVATGHTIFAADVGRKLSSKVKFRPDDGHWGS